MCYHAYFLLVVASHTHMNCLQDVNVLYTLRKTRKNDIYVITAPMYRAVTCCEVSLSAGKMTFRIFSM